MVDSHCHLYDDKISNRCNEIIANFANDNIDYVIIPSCDFDSMQKAFDLSQKNVKIFSALAVHPHDAKNFDEDCERFILQNASNAKVVALGEFGLDYFYNLSPINAQMQALEKQLKLCNIVDLPAIFHIRDGVDLSAYWDSYADFFSIVKNNLPKRGGVMHCFGGDKNKAKKALDLGFNISFTCNVTYKTNEHLRQALSYIPLDRLLIETDSPYLSPRTMRDKPNEPKNVYYVAECISQIKGVSIDDVFEITKKNTENLFFKIKEHYKNDYLL